MREQGANRRLRARETKRKSDFYLLIRGQKNTKCVSYFSCMDYDLFFSNSFPDWFHHSSRAALHWNVRCSFSWTRLKSKIAELELKETFCSH